jgi:hypothetical protein
MVAHNPNSSRMSNVQNWRALYRAALFERDPLKSTERILQAERVLIRRARELFTMSGNNVEERRAVDHALDSLIALRDSLNAQRKRA